MTSLFDTEPDKRVAIVTGGSNGIGLAIVKSLIGAQYTVYNLDLLESEHGKYIHCDMANFAAVKQAVLQVIDTEKQLDVLICNAGIHLSANIEQTSEQDFDRLFSINVKGAFSAIQSSLAQMKSQNRGAIIIIGSDQSVVGKQNSFAYNLSKHALASLCKTTALDYASFNIRVNAVCPGTIETPLYYAAIDKYCAKSGADKQQIHSQEAALQPLGRIGQAEDVANYVLFLASDQASFVTGSLQLIDGGYTTG